MPLALEDILVQPLNKGAVNATSAVTSLGSATTAGNTLLIFATTYGTTGITTPSGYARDTALPSTTQKVYVYRKSNIGASETLPTLATGASTQKTTWFALEVLGGTGGLDPTAPLDVASAIATATATSISTALTVGTAYDGIAFGLFAAQDATSTTAPTWNLDGFGEVAEQGAADATTSYGTVLGAVAPLQVTQLPSGTGTSTLGANGPVAAVAVKYLTAGSRTAADYRMILGFEWASNAGLTTGMDAATAVPLGLTPSVRLLETVTGTVVVGNNAANARNGNGYLEIGSGISAVHNATVHFAATNRPGVFYPFRFEALPATDTELFRLEIASGTTFVVRFINATSKLGVKIGNGTEQVSAAQVTAATWHTIDLELDISTADLVCNWRLNDVDQPQVTLPTSVASNCGVLRLGWTIASAAVMRVDDAIVAGRKGNWPLGNHKVVLAGVDTAATVTVQGTAANFRRYTANGTIDGAWDATAARDALDELPPTVGASNDGVVQVTTDSTSYVRVPLAAPTLAGNEVARGVRMLFMGWAASGTAATLGFWGYSGSETGFGEQFSQVLDQGFDNSTSAPAWFCSMFNPSGGWDQPKLDVLEARSGGSGDAAPDIGWGWCAAEVAVAVGQVYGRQEVAGVQSGDEFVVSKRDDAALQSGEDWVAMKVASHVAKGWSSERTGVAWHVWKTYADGTPRRDRYFEVRA